MEQVESRQDRLKGVYLSLSLLVLSLSRRLVIFTLSEGETRRVKSGMIR